MGKKKNKNKASGAVKTAQKTEKKIANKLKKEIALLGEDEIAKVVAEIEKEEAKRAAAVEKTLPGPPSARAYASLTPHPTNNELIMFGGEYHDGQKTQVYNDLLFYNPVTNVWKQLKAPGAPPPRSAHQASATQANKGEFWVFGGEFTSPSETQFYHYKDLWCFSLADKKWEKIISPNGPSPRSGHRMVLLGRKLIIFGGYSDDGRDCRYFDDLFSFCLDSRTWTKVDTSGRGPSARSACLMMPVNNDSLIIYGGFSRTKEGRSERTVTHGDMYRLTFKEGKGWTWKPISSVGALPRASLAAAVNRDANKAYVFGGINDVEETDEELKGEMSGDLRLIDLETAKWYDVTLKSHSLPVVLEKKEEVTPSVDEDKVTVVTGEVFTMRLGASPSAQPSLATSAASPAPCSPAPSSRMSAMMAVHRSVLYVYGGLLEKEEKQFYLSDMYSLDLHKLIEWKTIIPQPRLPEWLGSDAESSGWESGDSDEESDSESDSE